MRAAEFKAEIHNIIMFYNINYYEMKKDSTKILAIKAVIAVLCLTMLVLSCIYLTAVPKIVLLIAVILFSSIGVVTSNLNLSRHEIIFKSFVILFIICSIFLICYIILDKVAFFNRFQDMEMILEFIRSTKHWGIIVYILLIIFNVIVLPLPAAVPAFVGEKLYGPLFAFIYMSIGTIIGSIITFMLGKIFGKKLVAWVVGKEKTEKYADFLSKKGKIPFIAMMLFPFFPDDIICLIAGMSSMSYKFFIITVSITRPIIIAATCFLVGGSIIPFSGWGIPIWIALFSLCIVLFIFTEKIKNRFIEKKKNRTAGHKKSSVKTKSGDANI